MKKNIDFEEFKDFTYNPVLKQLLINYCLMNYEEDAITDDWHLLQEFYYLKREGKLHLLFSCEMIENYCEDEKY